MLNNTITSQVVNNNVVVVTSENTINVTQPITNVIEVATPGPQGIPGPTIDTSSFATTGSNIFRGNQLISASGFNLSALDIHAKDDGLWTFRTYNDTYSSTLIGLASWIDNTGISFLGTETNKPLYIYNNANYYQPTLAISSSGITVNNTLTINGNQIITGSVNITGSLTVNTINVGQNTLNFVDSNNVILTSLSVSGSNLVLSTGSFSSPQGGLTGSLDGTSSWAQNVISSSYALTASYAMNGGGGGSNIDTGSFVTTSSFNSFTSSINSATSSYITNSQTSSFVQNSQTSSMLAPYVLNSSTSSFVQNSQTSSFVTNSQTSSFSTGSFTGSFTGSLQGTASWASNVLTASYVVTAQTASYVLQAVSSSFALTASLAPNYVLNSATSSFVTNSQTSSFVQNSQTSSFVTNSQTSSFVTNSQTSSFVTNSQTGSFATTGSNIFKSNQTISGSVTITGSIILTGSLNVSGSITSSLFGTASWATNALTASYITSSNVIGTVTSASYALSASYAANAAGGAAFPYNGTAIITGSLITSGSTTTHINDVIITGSLIVSSSGTNISNIIGGSTSGSRLSFKATNITGVPTSVSNMFSFFSNNTTELLRIGDSLNGQVDTAIWGAGNNGSGNYAMRFGSTYCYINGSSDARIMINGSAIIQCSSATATMTQGITFSDGKNMTFNATTGTKIGTATTEKLAFWNKTPIIQPTSSIATASFVANAGGTTVTNLSTFGGYTIGQIAQALQNAGLLA